MLSCSGSFEHVYYLLPVILPAHSVNGFDFCQRSLTVSVLSVHVRTCCNEYANYIGVIIVSCCPVKSGLLGVF